MSDHRKKSPLVLAVDLGTSGCKTALVALGGKGDNGEIESASVIGFEFAPVELVLPPGGGCEQRPEDWWQAFLITAERLLKKQSHYREQIVAICCSTQGEGTVCIDEKGEALGNAILWLDMRGAPYVEKLAGGWPSVSGYGAAKLWRWIRLTGGAPALSGKDPAAHMLLIKHEHPDLYRRTHKFLNVIDYMNLRLTGRAAATSDSILTSWVTDNRDPANIRYDDGLVKMSGIEKGKLPDIVKCTDVVGMLRADVAQQLKLPQLPVVAGSIDNTASALGSGCVDFGDAHLYIGTSSWIAAHVPKKKTDVFSSVAAVPCALDDRYLMTALQSSAGSNLSYLKDRILYHEDELLREEHVPDVYKILDRIAERTEAGSGGLIYMPWLYGERVPVEDRTLRAGLFNLSLEHNRSHIIRAFFEGVALNTRWMLTPVEKFLGKKLDRITIVGGGASSNVWCSIFADTLGISVRQLDQPVQANALGSAFMAGLALNLIKRSDISERTRIRATYQPDPDRRTVMNRSFETFLELHRRLAPVYHRIRGLKK